MQRYECFLREVKRGDLIYGHNSVISKIFSPEEIEKNQYRIVSTFDKALLLMYFIERFERQIQSSPQNCTDRVYDAAEKSSKEEELRKIAVCSPNAVKFASEFKRFCDAYKLLRIDPKDMTHATGDICKALLLWGAIWEKTIHFLLLPGEENDAIEDDGLITKKSSHQEISAHPPPLRDWGAYERWLLCSSPDRPPKAFTVSELRFSYRNKILASTIVFRSGEDLHQVLAPWQDETRKPLGQAPTLWKEYGAKCKGNDFRKYVMPYVLEKLRAFYESLIKGHIEENILEKEASLVVQMLKLGLPGYYKMKFDSSSDCRWLDKKLEKYCDEVRKNAISVKCGKIEPVYYCLSIYKENIDVSKSAGERIGILPSSSFAKSAATVV